MEAKTDYTSAYEVREGRVHVTIRAAEERTHSLGLWGDRVTELWPRVELHTDHEPGAREPYGFVKIRGRDYRLHTLVQQVPEGRRWNDLLGSEVIWQHESHPYRGGYVNGNLLPVGFDSKARERLCEIEIEVLTLHEAFCPDWQRISARLGLEAQRSSQEHKALLARGEIVKAEEKIAEINKRIAEL